MIRNYRLWRVLTSVFSFLLIVSICGTSVAMQNFDNICASLGTPSSKIVIDENAAKTDTEYYKSAYGDLSAANLEKLRKDAYAQVEQEAAEGTVLLRNENNALPLGSAERSVSLFGRASVDPLYVGGGAVATSYTDDSITVNLKEAFENNGFQVNSTLYSAYQSSELTRTVDNPGEVPSSFYTDSIKNSWQNAYHDAAVVILSRYAGEGNDLKIHAVDDDGKEISSLALYKNERDLLNLLRTEKSNGTIQKIIVLVNSPWMLELGWMDDYDVDAALWIGTPGVTGFTSIVKLITGEINPSGRLVDTIAANSLSAPAVANAIDNTATWQNVDEVIANAWYGGSVVNANNTPDFISYVSVQQENIYIGYKYYETRYEDCILNQGNAGGSAGVFAGSGNWNYAEEVSFPFGYGLSYTSFTRTIDSVKYLEDSDEYELTVTVRNIGSTVGKSSVPVYVQTPYGEYERTNAVEKAAIQLVGFGKTGMLEPGASEELKILVDRYLLASYDANNAKGYILSEGEYFFAVGDDVHEALNNILAVKGAEGMSDIFGNPVQGDPAQVYTLTEKFDADFYQHSEKTGVVVTNQFDDNDINYWNTTPVKYLSRSDWEGTFPTQAASVVCTEEMMKQLRQDVYEKPENSPEVSDFKQGVKNGLTFIMMKDVDYEDDVTWDEYLDQFTVADLAMNLTDFSGCQEQLLVQRPAAYVSDGIIGPRGTYAYGDNAQPCVYTGQNIFSATFNKDLIVKRAELLSEEGLYVEHNENWGLGGDLHRTQFGGRNWEYCSEDANLTAIITEILTETMLEKGFMPSIKHFCGNDQESYRNGVSTFYTEQSFREGSLRGFEGSLSWGGSMGTMASMARQGMTYTPAESALITNVLREEWGFTGHVISDMCARQTFMQGFLGQIAAQTDNFCGTGMLKDSVTGISTPGYMAIEAIENGDGYMMYCLRRAVKNYTHSMLHTNLVNGLSNNSTVVSVTPWWQTTLYLLIGISAVLTAGTATCLLLSKTIFNKKREG